MIKNKFLFALASIAFAGCVITDNGNDTDNADTGNGTGQTSAQTTAQMTAGETAGESAGETAGTGADTGVADSGSGGADTGGPGGMYCQQSCTEDVDCCNGAPNCPGAWPLNVTCGANGACEYGGCTPADDCTFGGVQAGFECHELSGYGACIPVCETDADCVEGETCTGAADDGTAYCVLPPCTTDADCSEGFTCDTGSGGCLPPTCADDTECTDGFVCV